MSIIQEALKKAEQSKKTPLPIAKTETPSFERSGQRDVFALPADKVAFTAIGILLCVVLFSFVWLRSRTQEAQKPTAVNKDIASAPKLIATLEPAEKDYSKDSSLTAASGVVPRPLEPDLPPVVKGPGPDIDLHLTGIMYTPKKPLAMINNRILAEGDSIGSARLVKIKNDRVVFEVQGEGTFEIQIKK